MTAPTAIRPRWLTRDVPLPSVAVVARAAAVAGLARSTLRRLGAGAELAASASDDVLLVVGAETDLPWSDGAVYLGWDGGLLLPTTLHLVPSAAVIAPAARRCSEPNDLVVVLPGQVLITKVPRPQIDRAQLSRLAGDVR